MLTTRIIPRRWGVPVLLLLAGGGLLTAVTADDARIGSLSYDGQRREIRIQVPAAVATGAQRLQQWQTSRAGAALQVIIEGWRDKEYAYPYDNVPAVPSVETADFVRVEIQGAAKILVPEGRPAVTPAEASAAPEVPSVDLGDPAPKLGDPDPAVPPAEEPPPVPRDVAPPEPQDEPTVVPQKKSESQPAHPETKPTREGAEAASDGPRIPPAPDTPPANASPEPARPDPEGTGPGAAAVQEPPTLPPYLVVPLTAGERSPAVRCRVYRDGTYPPQPAPEGAVFDLRPVRHTELPRFFEAIGGLHVFAVVHPITGETVCLQLHLPEGRPTIEVDANDLEFDYGELEVEIDFRSDGRATVKYDT